jgi:hypothetical protein
MIANGGQQCFDSSVVVQLNAIISTGAAQSPGAGVSFQDLQPMADIIGMADRRNNTKRSANECRC